MTESIYLRPFVVTMKDCNHQEEIKVTSLIDYMQDAAWQNAAALGFNTTDLLKYNHTWVLHRMKIQFKKMPGYNDQFWIETWPAGMDKYQTKRDFRIWSADEAVLAEATSDWLVMDIVQRRLIAIPDYIKSARLTADRDNIPAIAGKLKYKNDTGHNSVPIHVSYFDLDINNHVNNTKLIQWVLDALPADQLRSKKMSTIDIAFKKEVSLGTKLFSGAYWDEAKQAYVHGLFEQENGQVYALAETTFSD